MAAAPGRVTATRIFKDQKKGHWYYGEEVEVEVWPNRFLELAFGDHHLIWMGLEVKTRDPLWKRKTLAFAMDPYSLNWFGQATFLPAAKSKAHAAGLLRKALANQPDTAMALESLAYDVFETNRKWLTARLKNPLRARLRDAVPVDDQFWSAPTVNYTYGAKGSQKRPTWLFAVCGDFEGAVRDVTTETIPRIPDTLPFDKDLLEASVRQALGGRVGGDRPQRVAVKAALIYTKHAEAAAKRSGAAPR